MSYVDICPHCKSSQRGAPIPAEHFVHLPDCPLPEGDKFFPGRCFCLPYGDKPEGERFFYRTIMMEVVDVYDGGLFYECPDCGGRWHRWPEGSRLRVLAEQFVRKTDMVGDNT